MDLPTPSRWLELVGSPLLLLGSGGCEVVEVNMAARRLFGALTLPIPPLPLETLIGRAASEELRALVIGGTPGQFGSAATLDCQVGDEVRALTLHLAALPGTADRWLVTVMDQMPAARSWHEDLQAILNWLPVGVEILDSALVTLFSNAHVDRLFGYTAEEVGRVQDWWQRAYPDPAYRELARTSWERGVAEARANNREMAPQEWIVTCKDGSRRTIQHRYRAVGQNNVFVYMDVSLERTLEAELRALARTDALTGLFNRRHFFDTAIAWFERGRDAGRPLSVLMLDLDHFKRINDRHGHATGDLALRAAADRCRQVLRKGDLAARLGGEEFAVLLPDTTGPEAREVAERLRTAFAAAAVEADVRKIRLTVSIGGATQRAKDAGFDDLIERADRALYAAKKLGRNRVSFRSHAVRRRAATAE